MLKIFKELNLKEAACSARLSLLASLQFSVIGSSLLTEELTGVAFLFFFLSFYSILLLLIKVGLGSGAKQPKYS
jgi:hypothetical protein